MCPQNERNKKVPSTEKRKRKALTRDTGEGRLGNFRRIRGTKRNGKERRKS